MGMQEHTIHYPGATTRFCFDASFDLLAELAPTVNSFIITDENIMMHYQRELKPWRVIIVPAGETSKSLETIDDIIRQLIALDAGRDALIVGVGGGVVTDIAGFVAGIYKRGVRCGFVPTTILAMVDAAVGGKNGVDIGEFKNMIGLIRQPEFLVYDYNLLQSLPLEEWISGWAEIIKHACIRDAEMFALLEQHRLGDFQQNKILLHELIRSNALLKAGIVQNDEREQGERKLLNFGHTLAHAIENVYQLPHGHAVAIGMVFAAGLSEKQTGFKDKQRVVKVLQQYGLPVYMDFDREHALQIMQADKKKVSDHIYYILLEEIGKAIIRPLTIAVIKEQTEQ
jgi:3-dehydroquinate synthase